MESLHAPVPTDFVEKDAVTPSEKERDASLAVVACLLNGTWNPKVQEAVHALTRDGIPVFLIDNGERQ